MKLLPKHIIIIILIMHHQTKEIYSVGWDLSKNCNGVFHMIFTHCQGFSWYHGVEVTSKPS